MGDEHTCPTTEDRGIIYPTPQDYAFPTVQQISRSERTDKTFLFICYFNEGIDLISPVQVENDSFGGDVKANFIFSSILISSEDAKKLDSTKIIITVEYASLSRPFEECFEVLLCISTIFFRLLNHTPSLNTQF